MDEPAAVADAVGEAGLALTAALDVAIGSDPGDDLAARWLRDAFSALYQALPEASGRSRDQLTGAVGRSGDASLGRGLYSAPMTDDAWSALFTSVTEVANGDGGWWFGWDPHLPSCGWEARADATFLAPGWVQLTTQVTTPTVDALPPSLEEVLVSLLTRHADARATFGCVADDLSAGSTALDDALRRPLDDSLALSRKFLRGYSWATLLPAQLVDVVGREALDRAMWRTEGTRGEGVLCIATDRFASYSDAAVERVFSCLAPVLPPGEPRRKKVVDAMAAPRIVYRDARRDSPRHPPG